MTMNRLLATSFLIIGFALAATSARAAVEVQWWHAMGGALGEKVNEIAQGFNESQSEYQVTPVYKGNYTETMTGAVAAFRAKQQPHIVQVYEVGTATMMTAEGAIYPVFQLMADAAEPFDPSVYLPAVTSYYTDADGNMLSLPFNSSTPVLYYNKEAFEKAGLDPEKPPQTWPEVGDYAGKLLAAGYQCGFSTAWQSWIHLENFSAYHNIPFGSENNGFGSLDTVFEFNNSAAGKHIQQLADWQADGTFVYAGRRNEGNAKFSSAECGMHTESSAGYGIFKKNAKFEFGIGFLPYWPDVEGAPQNTIIGGASLWVLRGHADEEYKGVAKFFNYLSSAEVQADWHQSTGYLPITQAAYELSREQGFYEANPGTDTAIKQMTGKAPTPYSKGLRFGNFVQVRDVINEELETIWAGDKTAAEGLSDAVDRGNVLLRKFQRVNQ
jgi:sn-glycerol 3-phosphate transport system substrate-binding protein